MTAPIDYNAVLADLIAKRGQIDAAIEVIRALIGGGASGESLSTDAENNVTTVTATVPPNTMAQLRATATIQSDTFFGLSTSAAIKKYLGMVKRPQTPLVIAQAIREGGQVHAADDDTAYKNVYTALTRSKDFVKTRNKEWGLAEWYGNKPKAEGE